MVPSPSEIRALRGARSRPEFAALVGVTALTVYRWELPPDSPEQRRPRGKVLARLLAWRDAQSAADAPAREAPAREAPARETPARKTPVPEGSGPGVLAPVLAAIDGCRLEQAEAELLDLLASDAVQGEAARALATITLAKLQLLVRHDTRAAFTTLLAVSGNLQGLPPTVQLEYHVVAAMLHALPDARLFNPGRTHHHVALAEPLLGPGDGERRFLLGYAQFGAALTLHDAALIGRAQERFAGVRELACTPLSRCLAVEFAAVATLSFTRMADTAQALDALEAAVAPHPLPLSHLRLRTWRAEMLVEEAAPPAHALQLLEQAEQLHQRHRVCPGLHTMMMTRNRGEVLLRMGRLQEAEAALLEAARVGQQLAYTPHRIFTTLSRLYVYGGRLQELGTLARSVTEFDGVQRELARAFGRVALLLSDALAGRPSPGWFDAVVELLQEFRQRGGWAVAYRHLVMYALAVAAEAGTVEQAERLVGLTERALEWSASPTASALFRRDRGRVLARGGRLLEARQSLEAALAMFEASENVPEVALVRWYLAGLAGLVGEDGAAERGEAAKAELQRLGMAAPPPLRPDRAHAPLPPSTPAGAGTTAERLPLERLVVPLQRLTTRGLGAPLLQRELLGIAAELLPGRPVRLEEVDSTGAATELGARGAPAQATALEWFPFSDGVGRRMRLGVGGPLDAAERAALAIVTSGAALAFEVAGLRGFTTAPARGGAAAAPEAPPADARLPGFVAVSAPMRRLKSELARLSGSRATIIITGESGTGKEVVARAIHDLSQRADRPYVTFNSAAVPRELFEGQLFGYRKGAFTGATADHPGVIRAAEGGTLFLDEIGELPLDVQPKLLRFLENAEVLPLGERRPVQVDVRIIAATHRDLLQLVREGKFREDLYYRLQVIPVALPPLRERREDVAALARFFIGKLTPPGREPPALSPEGELKLAAHAWPGNVRELRNVLERALAFDPLPGVLGAEHLRL
jgi:tetratricopeptide (TPR) repeat protein